MQYKNLGFHYSHIMHYFVFYGLKCLFKASELIILGPWILDPNGIPVPYGSMVRFLKYSLNWNFILPCFALLS